MVVPGFAQGTVSLIKYRGVFDFDGLWDMCWNWFMKRGYGMIENPSKWKKSGAYGYEIERGIVADRQIDEYYKYNAKLEMHLWDAHKVEAVKDGRKQMLWKARIEIKISFSIDVDWQGKWSGSAFKEKVRDFYHNYMIKQEILFKHVDPYYYKMLGLHTKLKEYLGMTEVTAVAENG